jgi:hypothetical protein
MRVLLSASVLFTSCQFATAQVERKLSPEERAGQSTTLRALKAAFSNWLENVEFRSTFRYREGYAKSIADAVQSGIDPSLKGPAEEVFEATGAFNKLGKLQRFSVDFGRTPIKVSNPVIPGGVPVANTLKVVTNLSFDEITDGRFQLRYEPGESGNVATILRRQGDLGSGVHSSLFINPLRASPNPKYDPFVPWKLDGGLDPRSPVEQQVFERDRDHVDIVLRQDGKWQQNRRVRFWMSVSPPVITEVDESIRGPAGHTQERQVRFRDFQKCPGGMVARNVIYGFRIGAGQVRVKEWLSADLGLSAPEPSDFVLHLPVSVSINGLKKRPLDRRIDLLRLSEEDVGDSVSVPERPPNELQQRSSVSRLVNALLIAGVPAFVVMRFLRRRAGAKA